MAYKPMMTENEARRRLAWQDRTYDAHLSSDKNVSMDFCGRKISVPYNVFAPVPWKQNLLAQSVLREVKETDKVLDMGTGSGIQAILAASKSNNVTAVDVNPFAVECAKLNVDSNRSSSRIKVLESDLFENVKGKFNLMIFDPPFRWSAPRDIWERSCADKDYNTMRGFFEKAGEHLNKNGRILVHFGTSGDIAYFKLLVRKNGFKRKQLLKNSLMGWTSLSHLQASPL